MSKGGSIKEQMEQIDKELEEEERLWREAELPPVSESFGLGENQFALHVNMIAVITLMEELVGKDRLQLESKKAALHQLRILRPGIQKMISEMRRQAIVNGVRVMPPKPPEI